MELKLLRVDKDPNGNFFVLIVPLWNWNIAEPQIPAVLPGFNRTFMELK